MAADTAFRLACEGTALLWQGDFQNARQLLQALTRRIDHKQDATRRSRPLSPESHLASHFHRHRQLQAQRTHVLSNLLIPFDDGYRIPLRRAPDISTALHEAHGPPKGPFVMSLRELLGLISAHEWRKKGVWIPAMPPAGASIHPHYGVFSPVRGEYIQLVATTPLPAALKRHDLAFDIGTGTGVLAAILARRGVSHVIATDLDPRAQICARDNIAHLDLDQQVKVMATDLFPTGQAALILCNPPWLPARPSAPLERAVYDPDSQMLRGFLSGLTAHLLPEGEGWLILSDLAEHLGLRTRDELLAIIETAGLKILARHDTRPGHPRSQDVADPLHAARAAEVTSLWRLAAA